MYWYKQVGLAGELICLHFTGAVVRGINYGKIQATQIFSDLDFSDLDIFHMKYVILIFLVSKLGGIVTGKIFLLWVFWTEKYSMYQTNEHN